MKPMGFRCIAAAMFTSLAAWSGATVAGTVSMVTYQSGPGLGLAIPDDDPFGISDTITAGATDGVPAGGGIINRVAVLVSMDHTFVGDLIWTLESPDGTVVTLGNRPGEPDAGPSGDSSDLTQDRAIIFGDQSPRGAEQLGGGACDGTDTVIGIDCIRWVAPDDALSAAFFGTNLLGDWTLTISDNAAGDLGTLNGWLIAFEFTPVPVPAALWLLASGLLGLTVMRRR